ncbi:MAG: hypothetical protein H6924_04800 [Alphaproteobacteria bacterium]|nr:hypothetical protein [Alphaproteobacteria bacterium]
MSLNLPRSDEEADAQEYQVGYRKPPKDHRFQKGKSGNPKGRPRKKKNSLKELLAERLDETVRTSDGRKTGLSRLRVLIRNLVERAASGDGKALTEIVRMMDTKDEDPSPTEPDWLIFRYSTALNRYGPEELTEEFYREQDKKIAGWMKELRNPTRSIKAMLQAELDRKVEVMQGGKKRKRPMAEVIVAVFISAAKDNPSAFRTILRLLPDRKHKREVGRYEVMRPTAKEFEHCPAPGETWEEFEERTGAWPPKGMRDDEGEAAGEGEGQ